MIEDSVERTPESGRRERKRSAGLWPIGKALTVAIVAALIGLAAVMAGVLATLGFPQLEPAESLPPGQLLDVLKLVLGTIAGVGALFALVMAYRRQRLAEDAHAHDQHDAAERRVTELYTAAATQLGSDHAPVRLTALYTLERLANASPAHQQTIVNIVCAYLRMPFSLPADAYPAQFQDGAADHHRPSRTGFGAGTVDDSPPGHNRREELQVRRTAEDILSTHLHPNAADYWASIDLNLTGAVLISLDMEECRLNSACFDLADLYGAADFTAAQVADDVSFVGAQINGGAFFTGAQIAGALTFCDAECRGLGRFEDTKIGDVYFGAADFGRSPVFGASNRWNGACFGGPVSFDRAQIHRNARFNRMEVGGTITFRQMTVEGDLHLEGLQVNDSAESHTLPPGWRIESGEGSIGRVVANGVSGT